MRVPVTTVSAGRATGAPACGNLDGRSLQLRVDELTDGGVFMTSHKNITYAVALAGALTLGLAGCTGGGGVGRIRKD